MMIEWFVERCMPVDRALVLCCNQCKNAILVRCYALSLKQRRLDDLCNALGDRVNY